jgi:phosphatidylethanolamine-binding protein (PEBP) family uncharacterized protein
MRSASLARLLPLLVATAIPFTALIGCSDNTDAPVGAGGTSSGTSGTAGTASGAAGTAGSTSGTGGSSGTSAGTSGSAGTATGGAGMGGTSPGTGGVAGTTGGGGQGGDMGGVSGGGSGGVAGSGAGAAGMAGSAGSDAGTGGGGSGEFTLTSPQQMDGAKFDGKYTCNGGALRDGVNPELDWSGAPAGTKSFAMTFIDTTLGETSPLGQHWAIWNIPASVMQFPEATKTLSGDLATAKQSGAFFPPCAQTVVDNMDDQYAFTLYALDSETLNVSGTSVANVLTALKGVTPLGTAVLTGHAGLKGQ